MFLLHKWKDIFIEKDACSFSHQISIEKPPGPEIVLNSEDDTLNKTEKAHD